MPQNKNTSVKKKVNSKLITRKRKTQKKSTAVVFDEYCDIKTFNKVLITENALRNIAKDFMNWACTVTKNYKETPVLISDFFHDRGIPFRLYHRWLERSEFLRNIHAEVLYKIGSHREKGAIFKEYDSGMIRSRQQAYDPSWKKDEEWRAKLKNDNAQQAVNTAFSILQVANSDKVPELPAKESKNEESDTSK